MPSKSRRQRKKAQWTNKKSIPNNKNLPATHKGNVRTASMGQMTSFGPVPPKASKKRKREISDTIPDSDTTLTSPPTSLKEEDSETEDEERPKPSVKNRQSLGASSTRPLESRQNFSVVVSSPSDENECEICRNNGGRQDWSEKLENTEFINWWRCEMKTCKRWYHSSCIILQHLEEPRSLLFCPGPTKAHALFVCPKCIGLRKGGYDRAVILALKSFVSVFEKEKKRELQQGSSVSPSAPYHILATLDHAEFNLPRQEIYGGFDDIEVSTLVRQLHESILDYDIELQSNMDASTDMSETTTHLPLSAWSSVDPYCPIVTGQEWFNIDEKDANSPKYHRPITSALRSILGVVSGSSLNIPQAIQNLSCSHVYTGLISWFVFDMINNRVDLYGLPNMVPLRAALAGVVNAGAERWPQQARQFLQEVQLRTWYKPEFAQALLSNAELFKQRLETFLDPLLRDIATSPQCDAARAAVIENTIRVWSYLQSLYEKPEFIQPVFGDPFDRKIHEAYDRQNIQLDPGKVGQRKILWVLSRGFRCEEDNGKDGVRTLTIRARVVVERF